MDKAKKLAQLSLCILAATIRGKFGDVVILAKQAKRLTTKG